MPFVLSVGSTIHPNKYKNSTALYAWFLVAMGPYLMNIMTTRASVNANLAKSIHTPLLSIPFADSFFAQVFPS